MSTFTSSVPPSLAGRASMYELPELNHAGCGMGPPRKSGDAKIRSTVSRDGSTVACAPSEAAASSESAERRARRMVVEKRVREGIVPRPGEQLLEAHRHHCG